MLCPLVAIKQQLQAQRAEAISRFRQRPAPQRLLLRLSLATDQALQQLFSLYPIPKGSVCLALGGYGRQELYPYSDVDLLFLLPQPLMAGTDKKQFEQLIAASWDLGLSVSHRVLTLEQCLEQCRQDIPLQTALLEARYLAGDRSLWFRLQYKHHQQLDLLEFYAQKCAEMQRRHQHYQNTPYALEPNCKESPGGLRDLHLLAWLAHAVGVGANWAQIADSGHLSLAEQKALERASRALMRLRIELHLLCKRAQDIVRFDLQPQLARIYGFTAGQGQRRPSELMMQRYYWATRLVTQLTTTLLQSFDELLYPPNKQNSRLLNQDFAQVDDHLRLITPGGLAAQPANLFAGFLLWQQQPQLRGFDAQTLRSLWHGRKLIDAAFRQNPYHQRLFIKILQQPHRVYETLEQMTLFNILPRYIPAFRAVVGQMQHDLFHIYTVDQHTLQVIKELCQLRAPDTPINQTQVLYSHQQPAVERPHKTPDYPALAVQLMHSFSRPWLLLVAALFHDIGKGQGGSHAQRGAHIVQEFCQQHQINSSDTDLLVFLVKEHLLFSHYAQKKDFYHPLVLQTFINKVNSIERLDALYLLTVADIRATNPSLWNSWKATLFASLYQQAKLLLQSQQSSGQIIQQRQQAVAQQLGTTIQQSPYAQQLWQQLDEDYFARHPRATISWHFRTLSQATHAPLVVVRNLPTEPEEAKAATTASPQPWQVMVHAHDQPELFMRICEVFEHLGVAIQDAQIYTSPSNWVIDSFIVIPARALADDPRGHKLLTQKLNQTLDRLRSDHAGSTSLNFSYQDARSVRATVFPVAPSVLLNKITPQQWELSVLGTDRKGLLYDIARVFAAYQLNLRSAKIMTLGERVEDSFIINSSALSNESFRAELIRAILRLLS